MESKVFNGVLTVFLENHLDSSNIESVHEFVNEQIKATSAHEVVFDCAELKSISDEGLQMMLEVKKTCEVCAINVSNEIHDIMDKAKFTRAVLVRRVMRQISVKDCEVIGTGASSLVYRFDDETMVKAFVPAVSLDRIYAETESARKSLIAGINTAIPFDICRYEDGYATIFELIEGGSLNKNFMEHPENFDELMDKYVALLKHFHATPAKMGDFPDIRDKYHGWMDGLRKYMTDEEVSKLYELFDAIPFRQTMLHVDPHGGNIMYDKKNDELVFVDMADISIGHPFVDIGTEYFHYMILPHTCLGGKLIFVVEPEPELPIRIWRELEKRYFAGKSEEEMEVIHKMLRYYGAFRCLIIVAKHAQLPLENKMELVEIQRKKLMPYIDEAKELFARADEFFTD